MVELARKLRNFRSKIKKVGSKERNTTADVKDQNYNGAVNPDLLRMAFMALGATGVTDVFNWELVCTCPKSGVLGENCERHSQMNTRVIKAFDLCDKKVKKDYGNFMPGDGVESTNGNSGAYKDYLLHSMSEKLNGSSTVDAAFQDAFYISYLASQIIDNEELKDEKFKSNASIASRQSNTSIPREISTVQYTFPPNINHFQRAMSILSSSETAISGLSTDVDFDVDVDYSSQIKPTGIMDNKMYSHELQKKYLKDFSGDNNGAQSIQNPLQLAPDEAENAKEKVPRRLSLKLKIPDSDMNSSQVYPDQDVQQNENAECHRQNKRRASLPRRISLNRAMSVLSGLDVDWGNMDDFNVEIDYSAHINVGGVANRDIVCDNKACAMNFGRACDCGQARIQAGGVKQDKEAVPMEAETSTYTYKESVNDSSNKRPRRFSLKLKKFKFPRRGNVIPKQSNVTSISTHAQDSNDLTVPFQDLQLAKHPETSQRRKTLPPGALTFSRTMASGAVVNKRDSGNVDVELDYNELVDSSETYNDVKIQHGDDASFISYESNHMMKAAHDNTNSVSATARTVGRAMSALSGLTINWSDMSDFDVEVDYSAHINYDSHINVEDNFDADSNADENSGQMS